MSELRIIFLDIDGVCNSLASAMAFGSYSRFDAVSVHLLVRAAEKLNASFVLSSAWRIRGDLSACKQIFSERGFDGVASRMVDMTDRGEGRRGDQIGRWLAGNGFPAFAIVDDDSDMLPVQMPRFIKTQHNFGFRLPEYVKLLQVFDADDVEARNYEKILSWKPTVDWNEEVE